MLVNPVAIVEKSLCSVRFIAAPNKSRFVKGGMNVVDLFGILPYFTSLILSMVTTAGPGGQLPEQSYQSEMRRIAQIFRIMRILRSELV